MPLADGGFIVTWAGVPSIRAQKFNSDGARSGDEIAVWTVTAGLIGKSAATPLSDGRFVVTWEELSGAGEDSSGVAVRAVVPSRA
jgi:hypothetical protein